MPVRLLALLPVPPKLTSESTRVDEAQRQINADALRAVLDLVFTPLQQVTQEGTVMYCAMCNGAPYRVVNSKAATAPNTQGRR